MDSTNAPLPSAAQLLADFYLPSDRRLAIKLTDNGRELTAITNRWSALAAPGLALEGLPPVGAHAAPAFVKHLKTPITHRARRADLLAVLLPLLGCERCHGTRVLTDAPCADCKGAKTVKCQECHGDGETECCECGHEKECEECDGLGTFDCEGCDGEGVVKLQPCVCCDEKHAKALGQIFAAPPLARLLERVPDEWICAGVGDSFMEPMVVSGEGWQYLQMPVRSDEAMVAKAAELPFHLAPGEAVSP